MKRARKLHYAVNMPGHPYALCNRLDARVQLTTALGAVTCSACLRQLTPRDSRGVRPEHDIVRARERYFAAVGVANADDFEICALGNAPKLPECAVAVRAGDPETVEYFEWLLKRHAAFESMLAHPEVASDRDLLDIIGSGTPAQSADAVDELRLRAREANDRRKP